ncbi:MAG: lipoate--protein ligase [Armatimonadota bacterium]|nr:lipoate--protein ligase [Armatimonadota bacterium]MDR5689998.1 lipoate--protein ligase [Armatimonadota bacterium]MDR7387603.1 lipoate--protein ligase [Armatimonadota bacterium]MDR7390357.1 lipoate--protein ligase [Armatimonadota bacterium]MDR7392612.1 lipoate--protein ligase [Armatimonadota bacterium]
MEPVRVVDLGEVAPVRSQAVYHAVAYAMDEGTPDTVLLVTSSQPYVSIGYHQDAAREVDLEFCAAHGLPVVRREVGGGAVYLDRNQVFCQWIFQRQHLPARLEERFSLYVLPLVATYRRLGIDAYHRPVNDIQVAGRKIGGTGAASIGRSEVMVGSLMFDFDHELMARVLRVPSEKMRDKVVQGIRDYITTMRRELGDVPDRQQVLAVYLEETARALGRPLQPGQLTEREWEAAAELEERFSSEEWLHQKGGLRASGAVKIHADVHVAEATYKAPGGLVRATARIREGRIDDVSLSGDFTVLPAWAIGAIEQALRGLPLREDVLRQRVADVYRALAVEAPGLAPEDLTQALVALRGTVEGTP